MNKKLQVFVSSTYTDLIGERQAAVEAILDAGHIPAGMELFKGGKSQMETIRKWIDESDVYMLILGGRYGSIDDDSGKSYTQLEYEYAVSKNIPVFAVVLSESFLMDKINASGLRNTMEMNAAYQSFKTLVMSRVVKIVDDCKDIKIAIHSTLNEFIQEYELSGWIRGDKDIPEQSFDDLIDILKNRIFIFPSQILMSSDDFSIDALNLYDFCYIFYSDSLYFLNPRQYKKTDLNNYLYRYISPYFLSFNLVKHYKDKSNFQLTEYGIDFYKMIESRNVINTKLINEFSFYFSDIITQSFYSSI